MAVAPNDEDQMDVEGPQEGSDQAPDSGDEVSDIQMDDASSLDVKISLSQEQKEDIVSYLEENLPAMKITDDEEKRYKAYFSMYEMAVRKRTFPYEGAPSQASSDAYDKLNEWLEKAEVAFLITEGTFFLDKEETTFDEDVIQRMERTFHKKFFIGSGFSNELRLILFEAGYLGTSIVTVREKSEMMPTIEKKVVRSGEDLLKYRTQIKDVDMENAKSDLSETGEAIIEIRDLKVVSTGPDVKRINQTKFFYPRTTVSKKEWDIVAEEEFYTKSDLRVWVAIGEMDGNEVEKAIAENRSNALLQNEIDEGKTKLPEGIKINSLDTSFYGNARGLKEYGDTYEDEFAVYRVTMKYKLPIADVDPSGTYRSWIEVIYCPAGRNILSANFCQDGLNYFLVRYRPVPYKVMGMGLAQERFNYNNLDSDLKSYYLAALEQELGAPLLIRKQSSLWASGFRTYPGAATVTENPKEDAMFLPFPAKSSLAENGMKEVLGSSPSANKGAGYASGKREQILQEQRNISDQSRMHSISVDLDPIINAAWKILCRTSQLNTDTRRLIPWIVDSPPINTKLYMLTSEMDPNLVWTSLLSAIAMSSDAAFQREVQNFQTFHEQVPVAVNDPQTTIAWLNRLADYRGGFDEKSKAELLPSMETFERYQQQLGQQGGQGGPQGGGAPPPQQSSLGAQSPNTPFHRPPGANGQKPPPQAGNKPMQNMAFSPGGPLPGAGPQFSPRNPIPQ